MIEPDSTTRWGTVSDMAEHYKALMERHLADSTKYQALLFHAWKSLRMQQKGLNRQARRIKRLRAEIAALKHDLERAMKNHNADLNAAPQPSTAKPENAPSQEGVGQGDAAASAPHVQTDQCGFDRNSSLSLDRYVCNCGWMDPPL